MLCSLTPPRDKNCPEQRDERGAFITTYSGAKFFVEEANIQDIPIEDIAHALSMNCRFNGHLGQFYSVAQHSVVVSMLVPIGQRLTGLMHDVSEAFVPDMPRPFKKFITGFEEYEEKIQQAVAKCYGTKYPLPEAVKYIDKNIVRDEAAALYNCTPDWLDFYESVAHHGWFRKFEPAEARQLFLDRYWFLRSQNET